MDLNSNNNEETQKDAIGKITGFFLFRNLINGYNDAKNFDEDTRKSIKK